MNTQTFTFTINETENTFTLDELVAIATGENRNQKYEWPRNVQMAVEKAIGASKQAKPSNRVVVVEEKDEKKVGRKQQPKDEEEPRPERKDRKHKPATVYQPVPELTAIQVAFASASVQKQEKEEKVAEAKREEIALETLDTIDLTLEQALCNLPDDFFVKLEKAEYAVSRDNLRKRLEGDIAVACLKLYRVLQTRMNVYVGARKSGKYMALLRRLQEAYPGRAHEEQLKTEITALEYAVKETVALNHQESLDDALQEVGARIAAYADAQFIPESVVRSLFLNARGQGEAGNPSPFNLSTMLTDPSTSPVPDFFTTYGLFS